MWGSCCCAGLINFKRTEGAVSLCVEGSWRCAAIASRLMSEVAVWGGSCRCAGLLD